MEQSDRRSSPEKREFWRGHFAAWQASGLDLKDYCLQHDISLGAFGYWRRKFSQEGKPVVVPVNLPEFFQATLHGSLPGSAIVPAFPVRVHVGGRFVVEVGGDFDPVLLEKLLASLEHVSCSF